MDIDQRSQQPSGVRCLFQILRHLLRHIPQEVRSTTIQEAAKKNPLLQMILSNNINGLRTAVQDMYTGTADVPFETLIESDLMINTFWSIPCLVLWKDLEQIKYHDDGRMELITCVGAPGVTARNSLTVWPITDEDLTPIDKVIQKQVTRWKDKSTGVHYWQDINIPSVLRVRWNSNPQSGFENPYQLTDLAMIQLETARGQKPSAFHLVAAVRLRDDATNTDSFALFTVHRRLVKHEDMAIDAPESEEMTSYMLYYARGPQLQDPGKRRCTIIPPLLSDRPATKEQVATRKRLLKQSMEDVELADHAAQDRLQSRHGSLVSRPRTQSPSQLPNQQGHALSKEAVRPQPMLTNESSLFNLQTPRPNTKETSLGPSLSLISSSGTRSQFVSGLHVTSSFESPTKQHELSNRDSTRSSSGSGVKRSIEQDYDSSGRKRQRSDSHGLLNSPLDYTQNAKYSSFERGDRGPGNMQSHSRHEESRRVQTAQQPPSQPNERQTGWGAELKELFRTSTEIGHESSVPSQGMRHSSNREFELDDEMIHESRRGRRFDDDSYHDQRYEEYPWDRRGPSRGRDMYRSSGRGHQYRGWSGERDRYH